MVVSVGIILIFMVLWLKHGKDYREVFERLPQKQNELKFLYPISYKILQILTAFKVNLFNKKRKKDIDNLNVVAEWKESELIYNVKRVSLALLIILVAAIFSILYEFSKNNELLMQNQLTRPQYWQQSKNYYLMANDKEIQVEVNPREYTFEQVQENFQKGYEYILQVMKGENITLEAVNKELSLPTFIDEYAISVSWISSEPQIIDMYGDVNNYDFKEGEKKDVILTVTLSYLEYECQYEINVCVVEPELSKDEQFVRKLIRAIREDEAVNRMDETVKLPKEVDNTLVEYEEKKDNYAILLLCMGFITAIVIFPGMDKDLEQKIKDRNKEMVLDYSEIVSKLNILSGSGMSILNAWEKIVKDYEKKISSNNAKRRFAYEEMKITYYEIKAGESESNAYSNFGKRCNIHEYLKLGALLEQNVRKGAKGLAKMLEAEASQAFEQRKNLAKKLGEEAGTKMLMPMIVMLAIVMIIVLIPAFTSFGV